MPEAQPRDINDRGVLSLLMTVGRKHILMARSIAEGPNFSIEVLINCGYFSPGYFSGYFSGYFKDNAFCKHADLRSRTILRCYSMLLFKSMLEIMINYKHAGKLNYIIIVDYKSCFMVSASQGFNTNLF